MTPSGFIFGYHGCGSNTVERLVTGKDKLKPSRNGHDWLGEGVYFWVYDPRRAMEWAMAPGRKLDGEPAVVGGIIQLGQCLNLVEREAVERVAEAHRYLAAAMRINNRLMPENRRGANFLDNRVIEYLHRLRHIKKEPGYDTVMGYFAEGEAIYEGAELRYQNHLQICVRNPKNIQGYFLPIAEGKA